MAVRQGRISDFKPLLTNLAQTSHYEFQFGGLPAPLRSYLKRKNIDYSFVTNEVGLLCNAASIPGYDYTTFEARGNFTGIVEKFAHIRNQRDTYLTFYVDKSYKTLIFFNGWMDFISSGSYDPGNMRFQNEKGYHTRMRYPEEYKCNSSRIIKFDRDYKVELEINFVDMFPTFIMEPQLSYQNSEILNLTVGFTYTRYIMGKTSSISEVLGSSNLQSYAGNLP